MQREGQAPRPTKSERDSKDAKATERSFKGKCDGARQGIVRCWKGLVWDERN